MKDWVEIGGGVETGECDYVFTKDVTLRMVIVRQKVRGQNRPKKQLKLLNIDNVKYDYQVIVTNSEKEAVDVWRYYNKRACCENSIKEGMPGFGLDKVVSHICAGNYAWFELLMLAYNVMNFIKEEVLNQKKGKNTIQFIRERVFFIPGRLTFTSRKWVLKLERTWIYKKDFEGGLGQTLTISRGPPKYQD